jgi:S1-C subfamily serine protease
MRLATVSACHAIILATALAICGSGEPGFAETLNPKQAPGVADLVSKAAPCVVAITTSEFSSPSGTNPFHKDVDSEGPTVTMGQGSGVIISPDGYILTNNHVVRNDAGNIQRGILVSREDVQKDYQAKVIGTDPESDLALLKIEESNLPSLHFAEAGSYRIGDAVLAIGNPLGLGISVTMGIISAIDRSLSAKEFEDYIQTDAAINHGNSGGALINLNGELVGINALVKNVPISKEAYYQAPGVGFAIAGPLAEAVAGELKQYSEVKRSYLGAQLEQLTPGLAANVGIPVSIRGAVVAGVVPNSPANDAGLQPGDVITKLDGKPVRSIVDLQRTIIFSPAGRTVALTLNRRGKELTVNVTLRERPKEES